MSCQESWRRRLCGAIPPAPCAAPWTGWCLPGRAVTQSPLKLTTISFYVNDPAAG
jgi:hypothetical protein